MLDSETIDLQEMGRKAKEASRHLAGQSAESKNAFLIILAHALAHEKDRIASANTHDLNQARDKGLSESLLDRLSLEGRLEGIIQDILHVSALPDPVGEVFEKRLLPNGLSVHKLRTPLGVLGVIYEARPNVTIDIACLAIKTGNAVILRGGSETLNTNAVLVAIIQAALKTAHLPVHAVQLIQSPQRGYILELIKMDKYVDMIIPRGGAALQDFCKNNSSIPVITGGVGICHLYIDAEVDLEAALRVIYNAKVQRPAACNALDTVLVHQAIAEVAIPAVMDVLTPAGVSFHLDARAKEMVPKQAHLADWTAASAEDWDREWLSLILNIKIVDTLEEALAHIAEHSLSHSDGILTSNKKHAAQFVAGVDSACVYVNASTRFTDGAALGLGAEVAVTTQKLHARGPMGLKELTTYKWVVEGNYHVRN